MSLGVSRKSTAERACKVTVRVAKVGGLAAFLTIRQAAENESAACGAQGEAMPGKSALKIGPILSVSQILREERAE
ncbi:hypothetical protein SAMN05444339_10365 [Loktanella atrilutea]|uniref:Uncharacterized protein n=1 Tax=Loktanella atrilutea TaxID=366533 RepID=A0A1M4YBP3_LOKAT|nr:hypothetical protein SAMN05444339_10365 [Loktanella atrilutea]